MADGSTGLFRNFTRASCGPLAACKERDQKKVRAALKDSFPAIPAELWATLLPPSQDVLMIRTTDDVELVGAVPPEGITKGVEVLFFRHHDGPFLPSLKLLHQYPWILPAHRVDIGGCKYVVSGAKVMCPGLTSAGGQVGPNIAAGQAVAVFIEGKKHAVAVGITTMSSEAIIAAKKGICIENVHHLGDGLWRLSFLSHQC